MSNTIRSYPKTIIVSGGAGSQLISNSEFRPLTDAGGYISQVLVKAPNAKVTFDFAIIDADSFEVFSVEGATGKLNDTTRIPVKGNITLAISNASADGSYSVKIKFEERW